MKKQLYLLTLFVLCAATLWAATAPANLPAHYSGVNGQSGKNLWDAVHAVAKDGYSSLSYKGLWTAYGTTDLDKDGYIIDMYGGFQFVYQTKQCGSYSDPGDCYNREHSIPKSWFGGSENSDTPGTDIFHVVPTDGKINNTRSNYAFGEVGTAKTTHNTNGLVNKLGSANSISIDKTMLGTTTQTVSGPSGYVFEPDDIYKGDFARGYFGTMLRWAGDYQAFTTGDGGDMFNGTYTASGHWGLTEYGLALLMKWHRQDPVSKKEIDRNNGIEDTQGNRNPFIDYPDLAEYIWGSHAGEVFMLSQATATFSDDYNPGTGGGGTVTPPVVEPVKLKLYRDGDIETIDDWDINDPLPTDEDDACDDWVFYGWSASKVNSSSSKPTLITSVTGSTTVYAVYKNTEVTTSNPTGTGSGSVTTVEMKDLAATSGTVGGFTFATAKNSGSNDPAYNATGLDLRIYAKGTLTISSDVEMTKMVFNLSVQGKKRLAPITASEGTIAGQALGDETVTWTGSAKSVTFTVGEKADYGSDGSSKAGQFDFTGVEITTGGGGGGSTTTVTYASDADCNITPEDPTASFDYPVINVVMGETVNNPLRTNSNGSVTYTTSKSSVAVVNALTGEVVLKGAGTTTITAYIAATTKFNMAQASYTLNVSEPLVVTHSVTWVVDGTENKVSYNDGDDLQLPDSPADCENGRKFMGWTTDKSSPDNPSMPSGKVTKDATFYAVFATETLSNGSSAGTGSSSVVSLDMKDVFTTETTEGTKDGFTIKAEKSEGSTEPKYYDTGDMRVYAKGTVTVSGDVEMTQIVIHVSKKGLYRLAPITASVGTIATQASGDETVTWTGNAKSVVFTVGEKADYGSDGSAKAGQLCFDQVEITTGGGVAIDPEPEYSDFAVTCAIDEPTPTCVFTGIEVDAGKAKTVFDANEEFTADGLVVIAQYDGIGCADQEVADWSIVELPDMSLVGKQTVIVVYQEKTASYTIEVKAVEPPAPKTCTVYWSVDGTYSETEANIGEQPQLPKQPGDCENGRKFMGWTSNPQVPENYFTTTDNVVVFGDTIFYAVFATETLSNGSSAGTGSASVVSLDMKDVFTTETTEGTKDGITIKAEKSEGSTEPKYYDTGDMRVYAKGTVTVSGDVEMTQIVIHVSKKGLYRLAPITASEGTIAAQASGDETVTWTGNAKSVVFTVGEKADYGSDGSAKAGQLCFDQVEITTGGGVAIDPEPEYSDFAVTCAIDEPTPQTYTITFVFGNVTYPYPNVPEGANLQEVINTLIATYTTTYQDEKYVYTLTGWKETLPETVTGNLTLTAVYSQELRKFTLTFVLGTVTYPYPNVEWGSNLQDIINNLIGFYGNTYTAGEVTYVLTGWKEELPETVTDNLTLTAVYEVQGGGTAIESVEQISADKFLRNGVLYILRDGKLYNAQGARIN